MWKQIFLFFTVIALCNCQNGSHHHYGIHHKKHQCHDNSYFHLLYGGGIFYYLTFIFIKIKVAFVLGTILTIFLVAGKLFAILKYAEYMKSDKPKHYGLEKASVPSFGHGLEDHGTISYTPPPQYLSHNPSPVSLDSGVVAGGPQYDAPPGHTYDAPPGYTYDRSVDNRGATTGGPYYNVPPGYYGGSVDNNGAVVGGQYYNAPSMQGYGRSVDNNGSYSLYELILQMIRKLNTTATAFRKIKLNSAECKRKFVCKLEFTFNRRKILSPFISLLRDEDFDRWRTNVTIKSWNDCDQLYQSCKHAYL